MYASFGNLPRPYNHYQISESAFLTYMYFNCLEFSVRAHDKFLLFCTVTND